MPHAPTQDTGRARPPLVHGRRLDGQHPSQDTVRAQQHEDALVQLAERVVAEWKHVGGVGHNVAAGAPQSALHRVGDGVDHRRYRFSHGAHARASVGVLPRLDFTHLKGTWYTENQQQNVPLRLKHPPFDNHSK